MPRLFLSAAMVAALATPAFAADTLMIEDFIGTVEIVTAPGDSLKVTKKDNSSDVSFDEQEDGLIINGGVAKPDGNDCKGYYGRYNLTWFGKKPKEGEFGGYEDLEDYPVLTIRADSNTRFMVRNSIVFGNAGDLGSLDLELRHCGNLKTGDIAGNVDVRVRGSADLTTGDTGDVDAKVSGSGDLELGNIGQGYFSISGSGDLSFKESQSLDLRVSGSGDVDFDVVNGLAEIRSSGSGNVDGGIVTGGFDYDGSGSGDLDLNNVSGDVSLDIGGSGDIDIREADIGHLIVRASGSSNVEIDGSAETADLTASGSSDIYVDHVTEVEDTHTSHSSDIEIGNH